jgi:hypothetical protein
VSPALFLPLAVLAVVVAASRYPAIVERLFTSPAGRLASGAVLGAIAALSLLADGDHSLIGTAVDVLLGVAFATGWIVTLSLLARRGFRGRRRL